MVKDNRVDIVELDKNEKKVVVVDVATLNDSTR